MMATTRRYDREFTWSYAPRAAPGAGLIPVIWDGLPLNTGDQPGGLCTVVENVTGWLDSPPLEGNDQPRSIADGAAWGPKTLGPRLVVVDGAAAGPRAELGRLRDQLARRAADRVPAELAITDGGLGRTLTAEVRAGSEHLRLTWLGPSAFRYQVALTAADPALYDGTWQTATLAAETGEDTGRPYPVGYPWQYAVGYLPNSALLANDGNHPAPVYAIYRGDLTESRMSDAAGGIIRLADVGDGMQIRVATATLTAEAAGGLSRASFILPGSRPMTVPAGASARWYLATTGRGHVALGWRSAWV
jgi:hypothetical protein